MPQFLHSLMLDIKINSPLIFQVFDKESNEGNESLLGLGRQRPWTFMPQLAAKWQCLHSLLLSIRVCQLQLLPHIGTEVFGKQFKPRVEPKKKCKTMTMIRLLCQLKIPQTHSPFVYFPRNKHWKNFSNSTDIIIIYPMQTKKAYVISYLTCHITHL
jgi:hypothetical protein